MEVKLKKLLLIDYENIKNFEISKLDDSFRVIVYVGFGENYSCPKIYGSIAFPKLVEIQRVHGRGKNALDFYIACKLGRVLETSPDTECIVLSADNGYDPLLRYLNENGLKCKRVNSINKVFSDKYRRVHEKHQRHSYDLVSSKVKEISKDTLPKNRRTLTNHIFNMLNKKLEMSSIDQSIDILIRKGIIQEVGGKISYNL